MTVALYKKAPHELTEFERIQQEEQPGLAFWVAVAPDRLSCGHRTVISATMAAPDALEADPDFDLDHYLRKKGEESIRVFARTHRCPACSASR